LFLSAQSSFQHEKDSSPFVSSSNVRSNMNIMHATVSLIFPEKKATPAATAEARKAETLKPTQA
jgi:hypothetical protein